MGSKEPFAKPPILEIFDSEQSPGARAVAEALGAEMASRFGSRDEIPLTILAKDAAGALIGGLDGFTHWRWLYVQRLWIGKPWRGQGLGRRLLNEAEAQARARDCVGVYLDTFDEGAAEFYRRCGFERFGRIDDFPPGASRIFLMKHFDGRP
jgi:GNAT superfamily N-acetyltransferase